MSSNSDLLVELLSAVCREVPDALVWKNADDGISGRGDIDLSAPVTVWGDVEEVFRDWASSRGFAPWWTCRHLPDAMFLVAVDARRNRFHQLDVRSGKTYRGSRLFDAADLLELVEQDRRGFRLLRAGAEGLFKLFLYGTRPIGRPNQKQLEKEDVRRLLTEDEAGVDLAAELLGRASAPARAAAGAVRRGSWNRRAVIRVEALQLLRARSIRKSLGRRQRVRAAKSSCPILVASVQNGRMIPAESDSWIAQTNASHGSGG